MGKNNKANEYGLKLASKAFNTPITSNAELQALGDELFNLNQPNRWFSGFWNAVGLTQVSKGIEYDTDWFNQIASTINLENKGSVVENKAYINDRQPINRPTGNETGSTIAELELNAVKDKVVVEYFNKLNYKEFKLTVEETTVREAFLTGEAFGSFIGEQIRTLTENMKGWYYENLFPTAIQSIGIEAEVGVIPTDEETYKAYNNNINQLTGKLSLPRTDTNECAIPRKLRLKPEEAILVLSKDVKRAYENTIRPYKENAVETYWEAGRVVYLENEQMLQIFGSNEYAGMLSSPKKLAMIMYLSKTNSTIVNSGNWVNYFYHLDMDVANWDMEIGLLLKYSDAQFAKGTTAIDTLKKRANVVKQTNKGVKFHGDTKTIEA